MERALHREKSNLKKQAKLDETEEPIRKLSDG
jgi:hypothetical protein